MARGETQRARCHIRMVPAMRDGGLRYQEGNVKLGRYLRTQEADGKVGRDGGLGFGAAGVVVEGHGLDGLGGRGFQLVHGRDATGRGWGPLPDPSIGDP